jgi:hypothetical protein
MTRIEVTCVPTSAGWQCEALVDDGDTSGRHVVTVAAEDADRLAAAHDRVGAERLVDETFAFLLERESRASILPTFDLTVVSRYFPEYDAEIAHRLAP